MELKALAKRQTIDSAQTIHLHEPEWECSTLLDATRKIPLENVLIVVDDLALPFWYPATERGKGSDADHNGLNTLLLRWALRTMPACALASETTSEGGQLILFSGISTKNP